MMFKTTIGAAEDASSISYLRPETAQGMFVNFKNIIDSFHPRLPFGLAQIGKAFRNEIAPRDFVFRSREFEQMEIEYFVDPRDPAGVTAKFDELYAEQIGFLKDLGLSSNKIHKIEVAPEDRAHYSKRSVDTEFDFPFGQKELLGIAYRTDFDLKAHTDSSKVDLSYFDEETKERFIPHCIEPTFGLDRLLLAVLSDAYTEDEVDGEKRVYLKLSPKIAPVKVAVFPLLKNKPQLIEKAREVYTMLKKEIPGVMFDDNGNIGKRYRRQDEIGTPFCITIDFDTVEKGAGVTVRERDGGKQERVSFEELVGYIKEKVS
jgi:glycyl-tRNA synthetase